MSDKLKKGFEKFEVKPDSKSWNIIEKNIPKPSFNWWAIGSVIGSIILIISFAFLINTPIEKTKIIEKDTKDISKYTKDKREYTKDNFQTNESSLREVSNIENTIKNNTIIENNTREDNIREDNIREDIAEVIPKIENDNYIIEKEIINLNIDRPEKTYPSIIYNTKQENEVASQSKSSIIDNDTINRKKLFIPNGFTPNQASNNIFKPSPANLKSYEMNIFNRSGVLLFTSKDINIGWDGRYKGSPCSTGVYIYIIKFEVANNYKSIQKGEINLIR